MSRLRDDSGFSLVELMVASMLGIIILAASLSVMDFGARSQKATADRIDSVANGRLVLEQVSRQLRSQLCPGITTDGQETPALEVAEDDRVVFYASLAEAPTQSGRLTIQRRELQFVPASAGANRGALVERVVTGTVPSGGTTMTFTGTPVERTLAPDVGRVSNGQPLFTYHKYLATQSPKTVKLTTPVTDRNQRALVVRIDIAFDAMPSRSTDTKLRTVYQEQTFVRTADPTDPEHSPKCL